MKVSFVVVFTVAALLSACGTLGGALSGAGQDLSKAGDWIKSK
jgi:predicted small secreted protein